MPLPPRSGVLPAPFATPPVGVDPPTTERAGRRRALDAGATLLAAALGAFLLASTLHDVPLSTTRVVIDVACGALACTSLRWRRRWPFCVAVTCLVLGVFSVSATPAGLIALSSLAARRSGWPVVVVVALWVPSALLFGLYSPTAAPLSVLATVAPLVVAVTAWGMFVGARRQLLEGLRERARRAEGDQRQHEEQARTAERTRIAREMHDVLGHRLSLLALQAGALEVQPDLSPGTVRDTAGLLRSTARQALEELRAVVGVMRAEPGADSAELLRQPTLADIPRLVAQTRDAGVEIDLEVAVERPEAAPGTLGRDAYRIVQEGLTNVARHAAGEAARVRVTGGPGRLLHVSVRNRLPPEGLADATPLKPGAGLLGLRERVDLAGGTFLHGVRDVSDFVVEAELPWRR